MLDKEGIDPATPKRGGRIQRAVEAIAEASRDWLRWRAQLAEQSPTADSILRRIPI